MRFFGDLQKKKLHSFINKIGFIKKAKMVLNFNNTLEH